MRRLGAIQPSIAAFRRPLCSTAFALVTCPCINRLGVSHDHLSHARHQRREDLYKDGAKRKCNDRGYAEPRSGSALTSSVEREGCEPLSY